MSAIRVGVSKIPIVAMLAIALICIASCEKQSGAKEYIDDFYKAYLGSNGAKRNSKVSLEYSGRLRALLDEEGRLCDLIHEGPCGWGGDEDPYLQTQETGLDLSYETSGFRAIEISPGNVTVTFNVYPGEGNDGYYDKEFTYRVVKEGSLWAVDDVVWPDGSTLQEMIRKGNKESEEYLKRRDRADSN